MRHKTTPDPTFSTRHARRLGRCVAVLVATTCLPALADTATPDTLPVRVTLAKECGADRGVALPGRPVEFCLNGGTSLVAPFDPVALAGRRLTVTVDVDAASRPDVPAQLSLAAFGAAGVPMTSQVTVHPLAPGRLRADVYVPAGATQVWWSLTGGWTNAGAAPAQLAIRHIEAHASKEIIAPGTMCAACKTYLDNALEQVRTHFLFMEKLDLDATARDVRLAATGAQDIAGVDGALKVLAQKMNEAERIAGAPTHSYYWNRAGVAAMAAPPAPSAPAAAPGAGAQGARSMASAFFDTRLVDRHVGYVRLRTFSCPDMAQCQAYARDLRAALAQLRRQGAHAWVVDLRPHMGGNMWPALAALRPLLGTDSVGGFVDAAGHQVAAWTLGSDAEPINGQRYFVSPPDFFDATREPAAVVVGGMTSSSGEMLATAFQGRPATRSFGTPSSGYTTGVYNPPDPYGNLLGIAGTYVADRTGRKVFPRVMPDVDVTAPADGPQAADAALDAALAWLGAQ